MGNIISPNVSLGVHVCASELLILAWCQVWVEFAVGSVVQTVFLWVLWSSSLLNRVPENFSRQDVNKEFQHAISTAPTKNHYKFSTNLLSHAADLLMF